EVGLLGALAQPDDTDVAVQPVVDHVQAGVATVERDRALEGANTEREMRENRLHPTCSATCVAMISARVRRSSGIAAPDAAAWPPPPSASATFERSTSQSGDRRRLRDRLVAS